MRSAVRPGGPGLTHSIRLSPVAERGCELFRGEGRNPLDIALLPRAQLWGNRSAAKGSGDLRRGHRADCLDILALLGARARGGETAGAEGRRELRRRHRADRLDVLALL